MSYPFFYKSSFHISVLVVSGGTRRFTDLKSVEVLSEGRPLCRLPRLEKSRYSHSQAGLLLCGGGGLTYWGSCSSLSDEGRDTYGISRRIA